MEHKKYELSDALDRMRNVLSNNGEQYRQYTFIPEKEELATYDGAFVECVAIMSCLYFSDKKLNPLGLAKIFDMYLNEVKLIMAENPLCKKIIVQGYTVAGVYNIGINDYMSDLMDVAGKVITLPNVINTKVGRKDTPIIKNVCAMEKGMLFAINNSTDVDYFGKMMDRIGRWVIKAVDEEENGLYISEQVLSALKSQYQVFFHKKEENEIFFGKIENIGMSRWIKEQ